jgi:hypothetical protein
MTELFNQLTPHAKTILESMTMLGLIKDPLLNVIGKMGDGAMEKVGTMVLDKFCSITKVVQSDLDTPTIMKEVSTSQNLQQELLNILTTEVSNYQSTLNQAELGDDNVITILQESNKSSPSQSSMNNAKLGNSNKINITQK